MFIRPRTFRRYRQIAEILADYGFGALLAQMGLSERLNLPRRFRRRKALGEITLARRVRLLLEELGPTFIKFGQILSTRSDLLPPEFLEELSYLQDQVAPVSWEEARQVLESELEAPAEAYFSHIDPQPIASASLAQVHLATLLSGEEVILKIQRPNIEQTINTDLDILHDLTNLAQSRTALGARFEVAELAEEFALALRNELDFRREAWNADRFRKNFAGEKHLYVPKIFWDLTTRRLLVMERVEGIKIDDLPALEAAGYDRRRIAEHAARFVLKEVLIDGFFHADPHPGNLIIMPGEVIGVIDFGIVGRLNERERVDLARLFIAVVQLDIDAVVDQLYRMGVASPKTDRQGLHRDLRRLLSQYYGRPIYAISGREVIRGVQPIIYRHRLHVPPDYWLLMKTSAIMQGVGLALDPQFDIFEAARPYLREVFLSLWSPGSLATEVSRLFLDWKDLAEAAPRKTADILGQIERGDLTIRMTLPQLDPFVKILDRLVNRIIFSMLLSALLVALALLIPLLDLTWPWGFTTWLVLAGFLVMFLLALRLAWLVLRSGRWRLE